MKYATAISRRFLAVVKPLLVAAALALVPAVAHADATNLCVPAVGGLAGPPVIDGVVGSFNQPIDNDLGWNNATQVNLGVNGTTRAATMQLGRTTGNLLISFSMAAPPPDPDTTILLAFSPDGNPANDWRIRITPFSSSNWTGQPDPLPSTGPAVISYWRDSSTWNSATPTVVFTNMLTPNVKLTRAGSYWEIEIQIPTATTGQADTSGITLPAVGSGSTFKFYANILATSFISGTVSQDPWPAGATIVNGGSTLLDRNTPPPSAWGTLSLDDRNDCHDVSITAANIGVLDSSNNIVGTIQAVSDAILATAAVHADTQAKCDLIDNAVNGVNHQWTQTQGPMNTFVARPYNGMSTPRNISAKFYVADWGIPGASATEWSPIGTLKAPTNPPPAVANNPTPPLSIPSGGSNVDLKAQWTMSVLQSCSYRFRNSGHHCIQAELESNDIGTIFATKSVQRNMDFVSASKNSRDAKISVSGHGKSLSGDSLHRVLLYVDKGVQHYVKGGKDAPFFHAAPKVKDCKQGLKYPEHRRLPASSYPNGVTEALVHNVRGYLPTDCTLTINGRPYRCAKAIGSFGVVAGHNGPVQVWRDWIEGTSVRMLAPGVYSVAVPEEGSVKVKVTLTAVDSKTKDPGPQKPPVPKGGKKPEPYRP
jgi:hypothetical protein